MTRAIIQDDIVAGVIHGDGEGPVIPVELATLNLSQLRFDGEAVIDASSIKDWLIDDQGRKRLPAMHVSIGWQKLKCDLDAELIKDGGVWRVQTEEDRKAKIIAEAKTKIRDKIDQLSRQLTQGYTGTEEKGWIAMLAEAKAYNVSKDAKDAPGLAFDAAIRGDTVAKRAAAVTAAADITGLIPSLASGMRSRAEAMIDSTNGDLDQIEVAYGLLKAKGDGILAAAQAGDKAKITKLATTGWDA